MNWGLFRLVAWVKRMALAAESQSNSLSRIAFLYEKQWERDNIRPPARKTVFESFDQEAANKDYYNRLKERGEIPDDGGPS